MKFFFPDSQDQVDPSFDFETEEHSVTRVRQRDDLYAHEALHGAAYSGILVSKGIVDGISGGAGGRYSIPQRHRLYRAGVRKFFRLDDVPGPRLQTLGDCGAFSYVRDPVPPFSVDDVISFYETCGFDLGVSVDHVILGYQGPKSFVSPELLVDWQSRQRLTLELASEFLRKNRELRCRFLPMGVAQGWSPASYAVAVSELQDMGFRRIGIGGLVPLKTSEILDSLKGIATVRRTTTELHLFGISRCEHVEEFRTYGVTSFDSTSPFRQAFKDDRDNYHTPTRTFVALRVPQVDGNARLKRSVLSGKVAQGKAVELERKCLTALVAYGKGEGTAPDVASLLSEYEHLWAGSAKHFSRYCEALEARPWNECPCAICRQLGIQVMVFRGSERNKRRGFHNVYVFNERLQQIITTAGEGRGVGPALPAQPYLTEEATPS